MFLMSRLVEWFLNRQWGSTSHMDFCHPSYSLQNLCCANMATQAWLGWPFANRAKREMDSFSFSSPTCLLMSMTGAWNGHGLEKAMGSPSLIIFSDGSDIAYGYSAYIRWQLSDGSFWCRLIMAKRRISPIRKLSTPQMELNAAVLSKRGRKVIQKELRFKFQHLFQLVDSETVLCMLNKLSTRFKVYEGVRIGEVQAATGGNMSSWYWIKGCRNSADSVTRGLHPEMINLKSEWWTGPEFLYSPIEQWNLKSYTETNSCLPGESLLTQQLYKNCPV